MFNVTNYQKNANQNYIEVSFHTSQNSHHPKNPQIINAREGVEKRELSYTADGNVNWRSHNGKQYGGP